MSKDLINPGDKPSDEPIVIPDECGDSMWDAVLDQEAKACDVKEMSNNASSGFNSSNTAQECDAVEAKQILNLLV